VLHGISFRDGLTELPAAVQGPNTSWPSMEIVEKRPVQRGPRGGRGGGAKQPSGYGQEKMKGWQLESLKITSATPHTLSGSGSGNDNFRGGMDNWRSNSARDGGNFSRSTMTPMFQSNSMNSRSGGSNRVTLPRGFQRDESVKTGPQGRPASFGNAAARRGALLSLGRPSASSEASKIKTEAAAIGKKAAIG
jgi:hypothetical protein